jgi:hypothetical protein
VLVLALGLTASSALAQTPAPPVPAAAPAAAASPAATPAPDSRQICADAYAATQERQNAGHFLEAREQARLCSQPTCKDFIVKSCVDWLADAQRRIPTIVLEAQTSNGDVLLDVRVSTETKLLAARLDGQSVELDPGAYNFVFTWSDHGAEKVVRVPAIVAESQKGQIVKATFQVPPTPAP